MSFVIKKQNGKDRKMFAFEFFGTAKRNTKDISVGCTGRNYTGISLWSYTYNPIAKVLAQ